MDDEIPIDQTPTKETKPSYTVEVIYPAAFSEPTKRFEVPIPLEIASQPTKEILNYVWRQTNHVDNTEWIANKPYRSSMVGDLFVLNGEAHVVASTGFVKLPNNDIQKWLSLSNDQSSSPFLTEEKIQQLTDYYQHNK